MKKNLQLIPVLSVLISFILSSCNKEYTLFVGGFTKKPGEKGLSVFNFNAGNGNLELVAGADVGKSPSYFCFSKKRNLLYTVNEVMEFNGQFGGGLVTMKYDPKTTQFEKQNELLIPYGGPCYISLSADSGYLFIANYPNGSIAAVRLNNNGVPESITDTILYKIEEPDKSHAHMILHDPAGKHVYLTDLGLDRIITYDFDTKEGKFNQLENGITTLPDKSGPRHFAFKKDGSRLYVINELGSTLMVFKVDDKQGLELMQTLPTTREGFAGNNYCADIHIGKDDKFLYGSNRGENSIVVFSIGNDGLLKLAGHVTCGGDWPRNFTLDPTGKFLLVGNQKSDTISVFRINRTTGLPKEPPLKFASKAPACLKFF